jgi:NifU-like protein involved in Fe-S cluster formation
VRRELRALLATPLGGGELSGQGVLHGEGQNPICGDRMWLSIHCAADRITALRYRIEACAAAHAVAELASRTVTELPLDSASVMDRLRAEVDALGGLHRAERHAIDLFEEAFEDLLAEAEA